MGLTHTHNEEKIHACACSRFFSVDLKHFNFKKHMGRSQASLLLFALFCALVTSTPRTLSLHIHANHLC